MILNVRPVLFLLFGLAALGAGAAPALSQGAPAAGQPVELGKYNAWNAYAATAKSGKICYALAQPASRKPGGLNRDPAWFFISNRPKENVRNEVSVIIGFPVKPESKVELDVGGDDFTLYTRADGAFMQSAEDEAKLIKAMRGARRNMTVKSTSIRGRATTDTYAMGGLSSALERIDKECK